MSEDVGKIVVRPADVGDGGADDTWTSLSAWLVGESFEDHYQVQRERVSSDEKSPEFVQLVWSVMDGSAQGFAEAVAASVGAWILHRLETRSRAGRTEIDTVDSSGEVVETRSLGESLGDTAAEDESGAADGAPQDV